MEEYNLQGNRLRTGRLQCADDEWPVTLVKLEGEWDGPPPEYGLGMVNENQGGITSDLVGQAVLCEAGGRSEVMDDYPERPVVRILPIEWGVDPLVGEGYGIFRLQKAESLDTHLPVLRAKMPETPNI